MLELVCDFLAAGLVSPLFFCNAFLLNDRWRLPRRGLIGMVIAFVPLGFWLSTQTVLPSPVGLALLMLTHIAALLFSSRERGGRLVFIFCSAGMFHFLTLAAGDVLALALGIPSLFLQLVMAGVILGLGVSLFRPAFLGVFHLVRRGWTFLSLLPLALWGVAAVLFLRPDLAMDRLILLAPTLVLLAILLYVNFFRFFHYINGQNLQGLQNHILLTQFHALEKQATVRQTLVEQARIRRHDLRHYLQMLAGCLERGDRANAEALLLDMETLYGEPVEDDHGV